MSEFMDNELVYLWRENFSKEAINILKERHFEYLKKVLLKRFYIKFNKEIIEVDDFLALLDNWFIDMTLAYDYFQNKVKYIQYLIVQGKQQINNLAKALKTKRHYVLNESISYSNNVGLSNIVFNDLELLNPEDYFNSKCDYEDKINWIKKFLENYDYKTKEIFWSYFYGEDKEDIMSKLSLTKTELNNRLFYMIKKMKNAYLNSKDINNI